MLATKQVPPWRDSRIGKEQTFSKILFFLYLENPGSCRRHRGPDHHGAASLAVSVDDALLSAAGRPAALRPLRFSSEVLIPRDLLRSPSSASVSLQFLLIWSRPNFLPPLRTRLVATSPRLRLRRPRLPFQAGLSCLGDASSKPCC